MTSRLRQQFIAVVLAGLWLLCGEGAAPVDAASLTRVGTVGTAALSGKAHDVVVVAPHVFVATDTGLTILDASNPVSPVVIASVVVGGSSTTKTQGLAVHGDRVYLASQAAGVRAVDISNIANPQVVAVKTLPTHAWDVAVKDHDGHVYVYAVTFGGEMYVLDASNGLQQVKVIGLQAWSSPGHDAAWLKKLNAHITAGSAKATSISIVDDMLFTVDWNYGRLYYYDLGTPASPRFMATHYAPFILRAEANPGTGIVYMLAAYGRWSGVYTVPMSAWNGTQSTRYNTCGECLFLKSNADFDQGGLGLSPGGNHLFYGGGKGFEVHAVDISDSEALAVEASGNTGPHGLGLAEVMGFASLGDHIYVGAGAQGLVIYHLPGASD